MASFRIALGHFFDVKRVLGVVAAGRGASWLVAADWSGMLAS
jgi:hypothetical protein